MKAIFAIFFFFVIILLSQNAYAAPNIPSWVKDTAKWWVEGKITEKEFLNAIEYLVEKGYIVLDGQKNNEQINTSTASTTKLLEAAVQNLKEEDNEVALLYFNEALKREPDNVKALVDKGIAMARTGDLAGAKHVFDQAIRVGETKKNLDYRAVINAGIAISIYGNQTESASYFDRVITNADKVDANTIYAAYVNKGITYFEQGEYDKAIEQYDNALDLNPGRLGAIVNKANALQELKLYDDALKYFEKAYAVTSDPLRWKPTFVIVE